MNAAVLLLLVSTDVEVHLVYYGSEGCEACKQVTETVIEPLLRARPEVVVHTRDVSNPDAYAALVEAEATLGTTGSRRKLPTIVAGDHVLSGAADITLRLEAIVEALAAAGGASAPAPVETAPSIQTPLECRGDACTVAPPVWGAYFFQVGCANCGRAEADLALLRRRHPTFVIERFDVYERLDLALWLAKRAGREGFSTPALFVGDVAMLGAEELTFANADAAIAALETTGSPAIWKSREDHSDIAATEFSTWGPTAVIAAGLLDGINPCAFATLIFFVSYLAVAKRRGREILAVGGAFTGGVFLAYLLVGLGLHSVLDALGGALTQVGRWVALLTGAGCLALAAVSISDYLKARQGRLKDMTLSLPEALRKRINTVIRTSSKASAYVWAAFGAGLVVSILELACTGQVYLPTIIFVASIPELKARAYAYLVLYNAMFVVPLIAVFVMAYYGTTSKTLTEYLQKNSAWVKLGMTGVFAVLGGWLIVTAV